MKKRYILCAVIVAVILITKRVSEKIRGEKEADE